MEFRPSWFGFGFALFFFYSLSFSSFVASSASSWLIILKFFRTVNKQFPLTLVYIVLKSPVWCGLHVECAKLAETVMRDLQTLHWMVKDAFDDPQLVIVVSTRVQFETSFAELGATPMRRGDQFQPCMSGSSLFQGARQVPDGFWLQRAVHTGWGSSVALSCWVRSVAEARDENRDTRQGCGTACVPPLKSNQKRGESFLVLRLVSWCPGCVGAPGLCSASVCLSGLVVCSWPCCVVWFRLRVCFKRGYDPGHRPKDRVFPDRPTTCRAGSPWWPGMRGDDPRTDLLAGTPFYVQPYCGIHGGNWVLTLVFFVASSFFVFSSSARTHRRGLVEEPPRVERALSVEVVRLSFPLLLQFFRKVTHERRWFPWTLVSPISFG